MYEVDFTKEALENISALSDKDKRKVQRAIDRILENPYYITGKTVKLKGRWKGYYRYKVSPFRIFYRILGGMVRIYYVRYRKEDTY